MHYLKTVRTNTLRRSHTFLFSELEKNEASIVMRINFLIATLH